MEKLGKTKGADLLPVVLWGCNYTSGIETPQHTVVC